MKKYLLSGLVLVSFAGYAIYARTNAATTPSTVVPAKPRFRFENDEGAGNVQAPLNLVNPTPIPQSMMNGGQGMGMMGKYKDGTYTGSVADAFYGPLQVQVIISGGKITDVNFLQYPNDRQTSIEINTQAMPYLKQEAIQAQSANVAGVTGATQSSRAFIESLTSALNQAI